MSSSYKQPFKLQLWLLLAALTLTACGQNTKPSRSWEVASQGLYAAAISPAGDLVVVGSLNHGASLWRTPEHERLFNWSHQAGEYVELVAAGFSPDASRAITTDPRTLVLWDTATGKSLNYWATPGVVLDVALFNDNRLALLGLDNHSALVFDAQTGAYRQTLLHEGQVGSVAVSQDGELALTGSDDNTAVLWRLNDASAQHTYTHGNPVRVVALTATGRYAFTAAQGDLVALWDNDSGRQLHEIHNSISHGVISAAFSDDERLLAIGYTSRKVALYEVASGRLLQTWDPGVRHALRATGAAVLDVGFTANDSKILAITGDGRLLELARN
ncbi:MAG: hypothetical protein RIC89_03585 [Pseudomonadales bacterium]